MTTALTIMRMQPFHKGHQKIVDTMLKENDQGFVLIGSANKQDQNNPFSYNTRKAMLQKIYGSEIESGKLTILPINDINNPPRWVAHVIEQLGGLKPDIYYCGTGQDGSLFAEKGVAIRSFDREKLKISATLVREKFLKNDQSWQQDVPEQIIALIKKAYPQPIIYNQITNKNFR